MPGPGRMGGSRGGFGGPRRGPGGFGGPRRGPGGFGRGFGHRPPMHRPPMHFYHGPRHHRPYGYGCMGCCLYVLGGLVAAAGIVAAILAVVL